MITKLVIRNFKSIKEQTYSFTNFDLLVGQNNCGKSTILQALAIWQFCIDEFRRTKRTGKSGIQIVLPNFTAVPVPEFNLLWNEKVDRKYTPINRSDKKKQEYILIEINVTWRESDGIEKEFGTKLRYNSPQSVFAIPSEGWADFRKKEKVLPVVAYVPPFSGLEPVEEWRDISVLRKQVGKGQPGSILRNLMLLVKQKEEKIKEEEATKKDKENDHEYWRQISEVISKWFNVDLNKPEYERHVDTQIKCEYVENKKNYDIIAGGSGFHQTLTLLAFLYGFKPTTILIDEPDAHLHVNLQRVILDYFDKMSQERGIQFIIATHSEELIRGVDANRFISLLSGKPTRESSKPDVIRAMSEVSNQEITSLRSSPYIVYVEGDNDERIIRKWANILEYDEYIRRIYFRSMHGGDKKTMLERAEKHFKSLRLIIPKVKHLVVFDYDSKETAFHPDKDNAVLFEWKRKNIENYLLVPDAWRRALRQMLNVTDDLFAIPYHQVIDTFFTDENLTLPRNKDWRSLDANVFKVVNGKELLFHSDESLFNRLQQSFSGLSLNREAVAGAMTNKEIHQDIINLFDKIELLVT
ncbi:ATP-binding protein [bacterium]|nr:ATP-binding protein [bacterium]